jgi:glycine cleavage system H protein
MQVSGEVVEINEALEDSPETVNEDPYGAGWMVKVQCSDLTQIESLLDAEAYQTLVTGG